ncbi:MAG: phosphoribosylformylglycinamidine synthase subunit PurS [Ktedonobacteraceae bacterium]
MTIFQIEVRAKAESHDVQAHRLAHEIVFLPQASLPSLNAIATSPHPLTPLTIHTVQLYRLTGNLSPHDIHRLITELLTDPVIQEAQSTSSTTAIAGTPETLAKLHTVDVFLLPGVTDTLAESVIAGAHMLGITGLEEVETGRRYLLDSRLSEADVVAIAEALLYNPVIQHYTLHTTMAEQQTTEPIESLEPIEPLVSSIPLSNMTDAQLLEISKQGLLSLNLDEMQAIQRHYCDLGREPTDVELETIAQTWSEHCSHKTFKATIHFRQLDEDHNVLSEETIHGLLKQYLMRATESMHKPWLVSAFSDNAGIIRFTETHDIAFKVETHNHPSAIEPFGGANTGVGGVIRDVLGVSARPIACTDILCFGPLATPSADLPKGLLSPRRIASGVVNGVRDYGNKMGIPTVNGAILYNEGYLYNPLVFCGCLGILPHGSHPRQVQPGDRIVVLGGRTGRDGIHGATFSSGEMSSEINAQAGTAVQIGAPITEKKVADVIIQARDRQLYSAITDCGAGGFSSAIGEMGAQIGAYVELEKAPLKYQGLAPWEIWLSEAQERMVLAVPPQNLPELLEICSIEEVEASIIGIFTDDAHLVVTYANQVVADIAMDFLHTGMPERTLEATWVQPRQGARQSIVSTNPDTPRIHIGIQFLVSPYGYDDQGSLFPAHYAQALLSLLSHPNIASKEDVVRRYDHEVQGATVLKPLVGRAGNGPGDAAVLQPILDAPTRMGIVLSNGINPLYGTISPFAMAVNAVEEALRNLVAVGGDVERAAILDNFCWGNPNDPTQLGMLVQAVMGCSAAATIFGVPFISGKDSLNNEYRANGQRLPVIPTLLISAVSVIDDASKTVDMSLKQSGNLVYLIGTTQNELLGSHYAEISQITLETHVPMPDLTYALSILKAVGGVIREGLVQSCHDLSEGGLAVATAEMSLAGLLGMTLDIQHVNKQVNRDLLWPDENVSSTIALFSESPSRFLVEVAPQQKKAFEKYMRRHNVGEHDVTYLGNVSDTGRFTVSNGDNLLIDLPIEDLQQAWTGGQA